MKQNNNNKSQNQNQQQQKDITTFFQPHCTSNSALHQYGLFTYWKIATLHKCWGSLRSDSNKARAYKCFVEVILLIFMFLYFLFQI